MVANKHLTSVGIMRLFIIFIVIFSLFFLIHTHSVLGAECTVYTCNQDGSGCTSANVNPCPSGGSCNGLSCSDTDYSSLYSDGSCPQSSCAGNCIDYSCCSNGGIPRQFYDCTPACEGTTSSCGTSGNCVACDTTPYVSGVTCYYSASCTSNTCSYSTDTNKVCSDSQCTSSGWDKGHCCGNSQIDSGEECDDGNTVSGDGCSATCQIESGGYCGDGTLDSGEECDGSNFGGKTCSSYGYNSGSLSCNSDCTVNTSDCYNSPYCADNDNDNFNVSVGGASCGYPLDCNDNNANIYPGAPEECSNGLDEDCNGEWDYDTLDRSPYASGGSAAPHGDIQCPISISSASVNKGTAYQDGTVDVSCTANVVTNALFVYRDVNNNGVFDNSIDVDCGWQGGSGWNGNVATFKACDVGSSIGTVTFRCSVYDSSSKPYNRAYMSGTEKSVSVSVVKNPCLDYTDQNSCNNDPDCSWIGECDGDMLRSPAGCQLTNTLYTESCNVSTCGAECDASSSVDNGSCNLTTCTVQCDDYFYYNETTKSCTPLPHSCFDTDGGENYTVKGQTSAYIKGPVINPINQWQIENDFCSNNDLTEYYCDANKNSINPIKWVVHSCNDDGMICVDGACVEPCTDSDGDGYNVSINASLFDCGPTDCDDTNASIHPNATEDCSNGVDDNCNNKTDCADPSCDGLNSNCLATLDGYVKDSSGDPIYGASITVYKAGEKIDSKDNVSQNPDGDYSISGLQPGDYSVTAKKDYYRSVSDTVNLSSATTTQHNFTLTDGDCSGCANWDDRCTTDCSNKAGCDVVVPEECNNRQAGSLVKSPVGSDTYIQCCEGTQTMKAVPLEGVSGCMSQLVQFTKVVRYANQPVTMHVYTWEPCETS